MPRPSVETLRVVYRSLKAVHMFVAFRMFGLEAEAKMRRLLAAKIFDLRKLSA